MLTKRRRGLLVVSRIGLIAKAVVSGWLYLFFTPGAIDLWPFVTDLPAIANALLGTRGPGNPTSFA
ncbi:MAG: hypothetical protein ACK4IC_11430 [Erythrobacter sp.]